VSRGKVAVMDDRPHLTVKQYVEHEAHTPFKHEYIDGMVVAMGGGTIEHARLPIALAIQLGNQLVGSPCVVYSADLRIRILACDLITYPDLSIICGEPEMDTEDPYAQLNPTVLVEVTSPSSETYDRGAKYTCYQQIPSLCEYVIVSQREHAVDVFRRGDDGTWSLEQRGEAGDAVALTSIGCTIDVGALFRDPRVKTS